MTWPRRTLTAAGVLVVGYAVLGAARDPDISPGAHLAFLLGVLVAHDALLMPIAIGTGVLVTRLVPAGARTAVRLALFATAVLLVVGLPLALGYGRAPDNPSALPRNYPRGLLLVLAVGWLAALAPGAVRRIVHKRHRGPTPDR